MSETKGAVHTDLGKAVYVTDPETGVTKFSHIAIKPFTDEEIEGWKKHTAEALKNLNHRVPGSVSIGEMRAHYASQMITLVEEQLEKETDESILKDIRNAHAKLLRDMGETRRANSLYPENKTIERALQSLDKPHGQFCECKAATKTLKTGQILTADKYGIKEVWYPELGGQVDCYICCECGCSNVSTIKPTDLP